MKYHFFTSQGAFITLFGLLSAHASASNFNYNYVEIGSASSTNDSLGVDIDYSAIGISGSYALNEDIALTATYTSGSYDDIPIDTNESRFGLTAHHAINNKLDFLIGASYLQAELETSVGNADDTGYNLSAGLRQIVTDGAEFDAYFIQTNLFDNSNSVLNLGIRVNLSKALSLRLGYSTGDNVESISMKLRVEM
ncbi:MAG: porin family protein [Gammaproteobacteria bacterium]|nr:porin family protein [Gammaproteobacteria bacterium]